MSEDDREYYRKRAAEETTASKRATDRTAADAHKILAERYFALTGDAGLVPPTGQGAAAKGE